MPLAPTYPTEHAAIEALKAEGYYWLDAFWAKRGTVDPFFGGFSRLELVTVEHRRVAPKWNAPDYFELKFH